MAANISTETYSILHDSRGEDVRDSLCEACEKIAPELLPDVTAEDAGKVLGVNQYGEWVAARYVPYWRLQYITVTTQPTKTSYFVGEQLDLTGVVVTAHYGSDFEPDKTEVVTQDCNFSPVDGTVLTYDTQSVSVEFSDSGVTATTSIHLDISLVLPVSLAVTTMPTKTQYNSGDELDLTGIVVTATYNNGTTADVTSSCTFDPDDGDTLTGNNKSVTVSYESLGRIVTTSFAISVAPAVNYISVITKPTKSAYVQGDNLDLTGIVVKAYYEDSSARDVASDCVFSPADGTVLDTVGDQTVSVSYTDNGKTVATSFDVSVIVLELTGISVTTDPNNTEYVPGGILNFSGIVVTATYNNGTTENVTSECTFSPAEGSQLSELGTQAINISYTDGEITQTTSFSVEVSDFGIRFIQISYTGNTAYQKGDALDTDRVRVVAYYTDGTSGYIQSDCVFTPTDGTILPEIGTYEVSATYTFPSTGETFTDSFEIHVAELEGISIHTRPDKTAYQQGEALDLTGIILTFSRYYGTPGYHLVGNLDPSDCTFTPPEGTILNTPGTNAVIISYTEKGITKTTPLYITVQ